MAKVAINGFGRIGRSVLRRILEKYPDLEVVAVNDLTDNETLAHLFKHDSLYGTYQGEVDFSEENLLINGKKFKIFSEKDPRNLSWKELGIEIVLECTGHFRDFEGASKHLESGAGKVVISAPAKSEEIKTFVLGVNEEEYDSENIVSMASCTTNCIAPVAKVLNDNFGIEKGFMNTIHSYTNDQRILDLPHKDLRRARAAALNIIPTTTGATEALGKVIPELKGRLEGIAVRVPTPTVSIIDLVVELKKEVGAEEINNSFMEASKNLEGILGVTEEELVSSDFIGNTYSSIVDLPLTASNGNLIKVVAWYDNEYGYACRLADFAHFLNK